MEPFNPVALGPSAVSVTFTSLFQAASWAGDEYTYTFVAAGRNFYRANEFCRSLGAASSLAVFETAREYMSVRDRIIQYYNFMLTYNGSTEMPAFASADSDAFNTLDNAPITPRASIPITEPYVLPFWVGLSSSYSDVQGQYGFLQDTVRRDSTAWPLEYNAWAPGLYQGKRPTRPCIAVDPSRNFTYNSYTCGYTYPFLCKALKGTEPAIPPYFELPFNPVSTRVSTYSYTLFFNRTTYNDALSNCRLLGAGSHLASFSSSLEEAVVLGKLYNVSAEAQQQLTHVWTGLTLVSKGD